MDGRAIDLEFRNRVQQQHLQHTEGCFSKWGSTTELRALCCSVAVMNIWSSHITRLLDVAWLGGRWVWAQSGWQGTETGMEWVAGSDRGSGPSWGWQQAAQWMKAGQVMCGWGGGTLLLLKQMPWLLGLISPAKHHLPALAKNKLKHLWSVSVFLLAWMQRRSTFWLSNRLRQEPPETWAITVYCSARSIFSLLLPIPSLFHTPFSIFLHSSSWLHVSLCSKAESCCSGIRRGGERVGSTKKLRAVKKEQRSIGSVLHYWLWLIWSEKITAMAANQCSAFLTSHPVTWLQK